MTPKLFKCAQCTRVYFGKADRAKHVRQVHTASVVIVQPKQRVLHSRVTVVTNETDIGDVSGERTTKLRQPVVEQQRVLRSTSSRSFQCTKRAAASTQKPTQWRSKHSGDRPYKCAQCSDAFNTNGNRTVHMTNMHSDERRFACEIDGCLRRFKQKGNCNVHMARVHGRTKQTVSALKKQSACVMFELPQTIVNYAEETKPEHPIAANPKHTCYLCAKVFRQRCNLFIHMRQAHHNDRQFRCTACRKSFTQRAHLKSHVRSVHSTIRPFLCSFDSCGKTYKLKGHLTSHKLIHLGLQRHKCQHCAYHVDTLRGMKPHMKLMHPVHVTAIPTTTKIDEVSVSSKEHLRCTVCAYVGRCRYTLIRHMRQHTGERPYNCERCDKTFVRKCTLDRHMANLHSGADGKPTTERLPKQGNIDEIPIDSKRHKCTSCSYEGRWPSSLTNHMQLHTGERQFACDRCEKTYCRKSTLSRHMTEAHSLDEAHTSGNGDQVVSVHVVDLERLKSCDSSVTSVDHLDKHSELSVGGKAFNCPECDYGTDEKQHMRAHYRTVHLIG